MAWGSSLPDIAAARGRARAASPRDANRSLHQELSTAEEDDEDDEAFKSVIEVSSMDPRAAARAVAILKVVSCSSTTETDAQHHPYVEHGVLPDGTLDLSNLPHRPRSRSRRGSLSHMHSYSRGDTTTANMTLEESRMYTKDELLREAQRELEMELTQRGINPNTNAGRSSDEDLNVPGSWNSNSQPVPPKQKTPKKPKLSPKRKRTTSARNLAELAGWTRRDWKRLEAVYAAEQADFARQRAVRPMPSTWSPWPRAPVVEWDRARVVDAFITQEGLAPADLAGEWTR
jgi:hypothetical protein